MRKNFFISNCCKFKLASANINRELTQEYFDLANYTVEAKVGDEVAKEVKQILEHYFIKKQEAAQVINFFLSFIKFQILIKYLRV